MRDVRQSGAWGTSWRQVNSPPRKRGDIFAELLYLFFCLDIIKPMLTKQQTEILLAIEANIPVMLWGGARSGEVSLPSRADILQLLMGEEGALISTTMPAGEAIPRGILLGEARDIGEGYVQTPPGLHIVCDTRRGEVIPPMVVGKFLVTQEKWEGVMGYNPSSFKGKENPVEMVSGFDAIEFCNALSRQEGRAPVYRKEEEKMFIDEEADGWSLPTEAEWEYLARAGQDTGG